MTPNELAPQGGWVAHRQPRLVAPPPAARGLVFRSASWASRMFGRSQMPDIFSVLNINSRLFWGWLYFASRLMPFGRLPAATREKIILRTAWNTRSRYEWGQHVEIGLRCGVTDAEIVTITLGPSAFADPVERATMQACDELLRDKVIADPTWQTLSEHYDDKLLLEIVMLIGHYEMVAGFLNTAGLVLESSIEAKLQVFNDRVRQR
jgi:4-carboxymuconolactone decarboxylase